VSNLNTIGIPKGLLFYKYEHLWKSFFNNLNVKYIISDNTTPETLYKGKNKSIDEACLSLKIYIGHIEQLKDKCDCLFIPRIYSLEKKNQVCTNFNCLYDLIKNLYPNLKIIHYNIDITKHKDEKKAFIYLGKQLGFNRKQTIHAYKLAKIEEEKKYLECQDKLQKKLQSPNQKILLIGHPYNIKDNVVGKTIINFFKKYSIDIIYSYETPKELINEYCNKISSKVHWTMNKELLASFSYFKDKVDGTIIISAFPCGPDSLTNEMIIRKKDNHKTLLFTFEDLNSDIAIITRLESFIDMLQGSAII